MRALSIDVGEKHIGLAITDIDKNIIKPLKKVFVPFFNGNKVYLEIHKRLGTYWQEIDLLIVGDSSDVDYLDNNAQIVNYQEQIRRLFAARTNWIIERESEIFTTCQSFKHLKNLNMSPKKIEKNIDSYAAAIMMHNYFLNRGQNLLLS